MHEYSIVQSLLEQCEQHATKNDANIVTKVVIKIGILSGVEIHLFEEAFNMFKQDTICNSADLIINLQKIKILCSSCDNESELERNEFLCPMCQSNEIKVLDGEDMFLMSLELE